MKITIEFDGLEEADDARTALDGIKWKGAVWDLDQWLRAQTKYSLDSMSSDTYKAFEECREKLHEIIGDSDLSLN